MATSSPSASGAGYMGFNLSPTPQSGSGAFGSVPGQISSPPSIFSQVNANVPGAAGLATGAAGNIASEQAGMLSPGTQNLLRNNAAAMGVSVGQPGGAPGNTISNENLLTNMGLTSEGLSQQGDQGYLSFLGGVGQTQQNPNLLADIASNNATMAAAPNPAAAAAQQQSLMQRYFDMLHGPFVYGTGVKGSGANNTTLLGGAPGGSGGPGSAPGGVTSGGAIAGTSLSPGGVPMDQFFGPGGVGMYGDPDATNALATAGGGQ